MRVIGEETYEIRPAIERSASSKRGETETSENIHLISREVQLKRYPQRFADSPYLDDKGVSHNIPYFRYHTMIEANEYCKL